MGFIKLGASSHIIKVARNISDLNLTAIQSNRVIKKIADNNDYIRLNPDKFIYTRERAVSAYERFGLNENHDGFTEDVLLKKYATFINSPRYVNHENTDPTKAIGIVLDAVYHPLLHPKGGWVETITARDKEKMSNVILHSLAGQPSLLTAVNNGTVTDVSMGCYVEESVCTVCGNVARDTRSYCEHVTVHRGERIKAAKNSPVEPDKDGFIVAGELVYGVTFFELSDITSTGETGGGGADLKAKILDKIACNNNWECYIIDRFPDEMKKQSQKVPDICSYSGIGEHLLEEIAMSKKNRKTGQEIPLVTDPGDQSVIDRVTPEIDDKDEDKGLSDQAKGESEITPSQKIVGPDSISQETNPEDYPIKGSKRKQAIEADPGNEIGGKPSNVKDEEDNIRKEKFENIKDKIDEEDVDETEENMNEDIESEDDIDGDEIVARLALSEALGTIFKSRFPKIAKSERFKEIQDRLDDLEAIRKEAFSRSKKARSAKKKKYYLDKLKKADARIIKYFEQFGGNLQDLGPEDTSGDSEAEDGELSDQAKGVSDNNDDTALIEEESISQDPDSPDYPQKGAGKIYIANDDSDKAVEEMLNIMQTQNKTWDEAWEQVKEKYNSLPTPMKPTDAAKIAGRYKAGDKVKLVTKNFGVQAEVDDTGVVDEDYTPDTAGDKVPVKWDEGKADIVQEEEIEKVNSKENESPETSDTDGASDISQDTKGTDSDKKIEDGTNLTLESPATSEVTDPTELKQGHKLSPSRAKLRKLILGESDGNSQNLDLDKGTAPTKASPETKSVADSENIYQEKELDTETQGTTSAPIVGKIELVNRIISGMTKRINKYKENDSFIREQNEHLFKSLEAVKKRLKWISAKELASQMYYKGFFFIDENGVERNVKQRKQARNESAKEMMRMTFAELEIKKSTVDQAPFKERTVKSWDKKVLISGEGNVRTAISQASTTEDQLEGHLFDD